MPSFSRFAVSLVVLSTLLALACSGAPPTPGGTGGGAAAGAGGGTSGGDCGNACNPGTRCVNDQCVCDATTCPNGCCTTGNFPFCQAGTGLDACGVKGQQCFFCNGDLCDGGVCTCGGAAPCAEGLSCFPADPPRDPVPFCGRR